MLGSLFSILGRPQLWSGLGLVAVAGQSAAQQGWSAVGILTGVLGAVAALHPGQPAPPAATQAQPAPPSTAP